MREESRDAMRVYLNKIGEFELSDSLAFSVSYDEQGLWCVENDEVEIYGYGSTFHEAVKDLEESLRSLLIGFLAFPDEKLNERSKEIKLALSKYINIDKYKKVYDPLR
ncbi:conserved hypothetical protein [Ferroglobus placidus DSM 10642]|uniref:Uncharacterized protein n=1 Tax=Ferroglobus placidus (strain DSM 10642 / AEDII12DO) TaxID=589924 RepID=D3S307_FERPA|nr:hypothetical protein [Ferroglobus placidus]ADC64640.1 conserved hypothetical protein [Ferroglobus placidus DSM 10642]